MKRKCNRKELEVIEEAKEPTFQPASLFKPVQPSMEVTPEVQKDILLMRIVTWDRDSHALFDYESRQIKKRNLKLDGSCNFIRNKEDVKTVPITQVTDGDEETKALFSLVKDDEGKYFIDTIKSETTDNLWLVVRAMKNENQKLGYELKKDDIIKLGRIQLRVKEVHMGAESYSSSKAAVENEDIRDVDSIITTDQDGAENVDTSSVNM